MCMSLDNGRKLEHLEKPTQLWGERVNSAQKDTSRPPGDHDNDCTSFKSVTVIVPNKLKTDI